MQKGGDEDVSAVEFWRIEDCEIWGGKERVSILRIHRDKRFCECSVLAFLQSIFSY